MSKLFKKIPGASENHKVLAIAVPKPLVAIILQCACDKHGSGRGYFKYTHIKITVYGLIESDFRSTVHLAHKAKMCFLNKRRLVAFPNLLKKKFTRNAFFLSDGSNLTVQGNIYPPVELGVAADRKPLHRKSSLL